MFAPADMVSSGIEMELKLRNLESRLAIRNQVVEILEGTRSKVVKAWTTGAWARDANSEPCSATDPNACSWCLLGALHRTAMVTEGARKPLSYEWIDTALDRAIRQRYPECRSIPAFNDYFGRQQDQVIQLVDEVLNVAKTYLVAETM